MFFSVSKFVFFLVLVSWFVIYSNVPNNNENGKKKNINDALMEAKTININANNPLNATYNNLPNNNYNQINNVVTSNNNIQSNSSVASFLHNNNTIYAIRNLAAPILVNWIIYKLFWS